MHDFVWRDGRLELEYFDATLRTVAENSHYTGWDPAAGETGTNRDKIITLYLPKYKYKEIYLGCYRIQSHAGQTTQKSPKKYT